MNKGLVIGKKNSFSFLDKNIKKFLGRTSAEYDFLAAEDSLIDKVFLSSDSAEILSIGSKYVFSLIKRLSNFVLPDTLTEELLFYDYGYIENENDYIRSIFIPFCNNLDIKINFLNEAKNFINTNKFNE